MLPQIYYSHPIAGERGYGDGRRNFDIEYEKHNCYTAVQNILWLRRNFPEVRWYCPGEVESPITAARQLGFLTAQQALEIDFYIIRTDCDGGLVHRWEGSNGTVKEENLLIQLEYPHILQTRSQNIWECDIVAIGSLVTKVMVRVKEQGR